uniref:(northern house mosquito) hypothetical protein n=1 Tax=Culex pipiens TaxID=7175 RepID=A0A8D8N694_CULPI
MFAEETSSATASSICLRKQPQHGQRIRKTTVRQALGGTAQDFPSHFVSSVAKPADKCSPCHGRVPRSDDQNHTRELLAHSGSQLRDLLQLFDEMRKFIDFPGNFMDRVEQGQTRHQVSRTDFLNCKSTRSWLCSAGWLRKRQQVCIVTKLS